MTSLPKCILFVVLSLSLPACGKVEKIPGNERFNALRSLVQSYAAALRWGHAQDVLAFHAYQDGQRELYLPAGHERFTVTGVQILQMLSDVERTEALVEIDVEYVENDTAAVKSRRFEHSWWFDATSKRWFNGAVFPAFWEQEQGP